jgi:hypothetical protein
MNMLFMGTGERWDSLRNSLKTYLLLIATELAVFRSAPISQFAPPLPTSVRRIW